MIEMMTALVVDVLILFMIFLNVLSGRQSGVVMVVRWSHSSVIFAVTRI